MRVYVDLDNLYIINNKVSPKTLIARVKAILTIFRQYKCVISFYGNSFTKGLLDKYELSDQVNFYASDIETNSADHNLINALGNYKVKRNIIISGDMTLCRIARYIHGENKQLAFVRFDAANKLETFPVDFKFVRKEHLDKFIKSLALYNTRYPSKKYANVL
jgi:hypothetical protein